MPISPRVLLCQENDRLIAAHRSWKTQEVDRERRASKLREIAWALAQEEWEASDDRAFLRDRVCGGALPRAVTWEGDLHAARIAFPAVAAQKWRAVIWSRFVYAATPGREFTAGDVVTVLNERGIPTRGPAGSADRAVRGYLANLAQRGLLTVVRAGVWARTDMSWRRH